MFILSIKILLIVDSGFLTKRLDIFFILLSFINAVLANSKNIGFLRNSLRLFGSFNKGT